MQLCSWETKVPQPAGGVCAFCLYQNSDCIVEEGEEFTTCVFCMSARLDSEFNNICLAVMQVGTEQFDGMISVRLFLLYFSASYESAMHAARLLHG